VSDRLAHIKNSVISFNHPVDVWVSSIYPVNNQKFVVLEDPISFYVFDDWA
jgi:hypothetical protein